MVRYRTRRRYVPVPATKPTPTPSKVEPMPEQEQELFDLTLEFTIRRAGYPEVESRFANFKHDFYNISADGLREMETDLSDLGMKWKAAAESKAT